jgi:hypothetical protein
VHYITKHNTEFEGEGNDGEQGGVDFFVLGNTISIDNFLEGVSKLISFNERRPDKGIFVKLIDLSDIEALNVSSLSDLQYAVEELFLEFSWAPEETHENFISVLKFV